MTDAFSPMRADFDGIADRDRYDLHISGVFHKTFIDVNEVGTEAAAATGVVIGITSVPPPPPSFCADHPFLFALRDVHSGSLLFLGRLNEPEILASSSSPPTFGDYNSDGVVDSADYIVWRNEDGTQTGYDIWRENFGRTMGNGSLSNADVPEPTVMVWWLAAIFITSVRHYRKTTRTISLR